MRTKHAKIIRQGIKDGRAVWALTTLGVPLKESVDLLSGVNKRLLLNDHYFEAVCRTIERLYL